MARYQAAHQSGLLQKNSAIARRALENCRLCPRNCGVDRTRDQRLGFCKTGRLAVVASYHPHYGEEAPLVGSQGSGTIFFTHCNLGCNFCQNYDISHEGYGRPVSNQDLAAMMLALQHAGCHNINLVSPTHVVPQIIEALEVAVDGGLCVPLIYNSGGYDRVRTLRLLEGIVDIYMPDFKFWDPNVAEITCNAPDYPDVCRKALREMHRQVGDLVCGPDNLAYRGLLVRHLVMPEDWSGTASVMHFIASQISRQTYVNIMPQYRPCGRAHDIEPLSRRITTREYAAALDSAKTNGILRLDHL